MYFTIYRTTNLLSGKRYIGMHQTHNLDDGYLGSGKLLKRAIKKYGKDNFVKEILYIFDNRLEMVRKEKELVEISSHTYNLCEGGHGGFEYIHRNNLHIVPQTPEIREKKSLSHKGDKNPNFGCKMSEEQRQKISHTKKEQYRQGKLPWNKGKKMNYSPSAKTAMCRFGTKHSFETKAKIGRSLREHFSLKREGV